MNHKTNVLIQNNKEEEDKEASEDLSSKLLKTRTIVISGAVDSKLAQKVIQQLLLLKQESPDEEIKIMINSPGGEVTSGFGIFDTLRFVSCPITTIVSGLAIGSNSGKTTTCMVVSKVQPYSSVTSNINEFTPATLGVAIANVS